MATKKQASMQKIAGEQFKWYKVPYVDEPEKGADGRPTGKTVRRTLKKNPKIVDQYLYEDNNTVYGGKVVPDMGAIKRPVLGEDHLMDRATFPLLSRTLHLQKYKKLVTELRAAASTATSGVVNFVIGSETINADAILRMAFPPGSGAVFQGIEGFEIDASKIKDPGEAEKWLEELINGNPRTMTREEFNFLKGLDQKFADEGDNETLKLTDTLDENQFQNLTPPEAGAEAAPAGGGMHPVEMTLWKIEQLQKAIERSRRELMSLQRYDYAPDVVDPNKMTAGKKYDALESHINRMTFTMKALQGTLPPAIRFSKDTAYDDTGFMSFQGEYMRTYAQLMKILDMEKILQAYGVQSPAGSTPANAPAAGARRNTPAASSSTVTEERKKTLYNKYKDEMIRMVESLGRHSNDKMGKASQDVIKILRKDYSEIIALPDAYKRVVAVFCNEIRNQGKVLIINNAHNSGLVGQKEGGRLHFLPESALTRKFVNKADRKEKTTIVCSRVPLVFPFGGVKIVPEDPEVFLVDDEEGEAIVDNLVDQCREIMIRHIREYEAQRSTLRPGQQMTKPDGTPYTAADVPKLSAVSLSYSDKKRLSQLVNGKSQVDAINFLSGVINSTRDVKSGTLNGRQLVKTAIKQNNENVGRSATWTTQTSGGAQQKGMYTMTPKLTMDRYIHEAMSTWGTEVDDINSKVDLADNYLTLEERARQEIQEIEYGVKSASTDDRRKLEKQASKYAMAYRVQLKGVPHFIILYGLQGCGKSAYPEALAKKLEYQFLDANFGNTRGGLVGQTEAWGEALIESWKRMSNVVIRMDEIDTQLVSESSEGNQSYDANVMGKLLRFFQEHKDVLEKRNIFIVATTNHPERLRAALKNRADLMCEVPPPFTKEGYLSYLNQAVSILKDDTELGYVFDPEGFEDSDDLWQETESLFEQIKPEFPRVADALVGTGMVFRSLAKFVEQMFGAHMTYIETTRMVRLYNTDRKKYIAEYPKMVVKDENGQVEHINVPEVRGFPFTADNFVMAAKLTHPIDAKGQKITMQQAKATGQEGNVSLGIKALERRLNHVTEEAAPVAGGPVQQSLPFGNPPPAANTDLMRPAGADTIASTDYYFQRLVQAGVVSPEQLAPAAQTEKPETEVERLVRIEKGIQRPDDTYEGDIFAMYPVPRPTSLKAPRAKKVK